MKLTIKTVSVIDAGCFGVLLSDDVPFAVTLERTYEDSEERVKIPRGVYPCTKTWYNKGGYWTYEIHVPNHTRILFHKANTEDDLDGCIGVGEEFGELNGKPAILQSGKGFAEFVSKLVEVDSFDLTIE